MAESATSSGLARELTFRDGIAIVVGTVIGSGVYLVPGSVARQIPSMSLVLLIWVAGGLLTLFGALTLAELGAMYPNAGGLYVYLRAAYGRPVAFLYGWGLLALIHSGSIATLAVAFGLYLGQLFPLSMALQRAAAISTILLLTAINTLGLRPGKLIQNVVTCCKIGGIGLLVVMLLAASRHAKAAATPAPVPPMVFAIGAALVAVLWAYEGWHVVSFTAAEFRDPLRALPQSLCWGAVALAVIYLLANISYYHVLTPAQLQASDRAAAAAVSEAYGVTATALVTVLILTSILGAMNGMVLTGPRVYYAMSRDGAFFRSFGELNHLTRVPTIAIVVQGIWSACLTLVGTFQDLFTYVIFTAWIFYGLSVLAVILLRKRQPDLARPYRVPGYPVIPIVFVLAALFITGITIANGPLHALYGIGLILLGLPLYWVSFRKAAG